MYGFKEAEKEVKIMEKIKIEVWSDVVCPFCLIGKKKLEKAISDINAEENVEIVWKSFQLDPSFPTDKSIPSYEYLSERKGYPLNQIQYMCSQLAGQGKMYNIDFNFDRSLTYNTFKAHQLLKWSAALGKSSEVKEALMTAHFTNGIDLSAEEELLKLIQELNLDTEEAKHILETKTFENAVKQDLLQAQQLQITGVPYFLINGKQGISGAQSESVFAKAITAALEQKNIKLSPREAKVCTPEKACE